MKKTFIFLLLLAIGLPWAANAQETLTVYENEEGTNSNVPIQGLQVDNSGHKCEFIIPAGELSNMEWGTISKMTFYLSSQAAVAWNASFEVFMKEVDQTTLSGFLGKEGATTVYSGVLNGNNPTMEVNFTQNYSYQGGNLLIGFYMTATGTWKSASFYGKVAEEYTAWQGYGSSFSGKKFIPRTTFTYTAGEAPCCPKPKNLTCTGYTATTATFTWTNGGDETQWQLEYGTASDFSGATTKTINQSDLVNGEYTLNGLTAEQTYYARIKAYCPSCTPNYSEPSNTCEFKPSNVQTVAIGSGESTNNYLPAYTYNNNTLSEQIYTAAEIGMAGTINSIAFYNAGSTKNPNFKVYLVHTDKTAFSSATDWLTVTAGDLVFEGNVNLTTGQWTTIEFDTEFEFDGCSNLGLVVDEYMSYSSGLACRVFSSTDNCSMYVTSDGTDYNAVGASYSGSRLSVKNQLQLGIIPNLKPSPNNLALVDGSLSQSSATLEWQTPCTASPTGYEYQYRTATDQWPATWTSNGTNLSMPLSGLTASTTYDFRVRANYADGDSDPAEITFTTDATCLPVTNITVSDITSTGAKLAWDDPNGATSWQYLTLAHGDTPDWTSERVITSNTNTNVPANIYACTGEQPQPNTEYDFYVRANCGGGDYSEAAMLTFRTACGAITSFPINYGFETSEGFPSNASTPTTNQLGTCWRNEATVQNGSNANRVWGTSTSSKHTGSQALVLPDKGNSTNFAKTMLVFPEMEFTYADGYIVSFWIYRNGSSSNPEGFKLYVSDCDTIGPNAVELGHYSRNYGIAYPITESASAWYQYETEPITMTGSVYIIFEGQSYYGSATYVDDIVIKEYVAVTADQIVNTVSDPATEMTWNEFVSHWNNGDHFTSTTFTLMDDINVSTMVGTSDKPFTGTFNGNSHTITVNLTATDANFTAPFRIIRNATIQNLKVDGTINDGGFKFCAGFAGDCYGNNTFTNCESAVTINATTEGDGTHGGFIARNYGGNGTGNNLCTTVFNGCAFTGRLLGANTNQVGGFCGWSEYYSPNYAKTIFNSCLFAPQAVTMSTTSSAAFARRRDANYVNFNNCYFMQDFNDGTNNTAQGKQAYSITGVSPVYVAFSGEHTLYNMSGIDAYTEGMEHGYTKLAGEGDNVTLSLSGAPGYEANHGTLVANGETYTLTMEAYDTEISGVDCPVPFNVAVPAANLTARSAQVTWNGGSDSYTVQYREVVTAPVDVNDTYGFEDGTQGWTTIDADGHGDAWSRYNGDAHNGSYSMRAKYNSSYAHQDYLVSPQITLGGSLSFYAKKGGSYTDTFRVYLSTSGNTSASDFTIELTDGDVLPPTTYEQYTYDLSAYSGMGYVAIVYTAPKDQYYLYVDDITITNHIDGEYGAWQTVNNAASPQALENLTPETTYQVKVSGTCAGVPTDYSDVVEFTTPATCPAPTELAVTDGSVTAHAATITWTENGEATTWIVEYADNADFTGALTETVEDNATYSFDELDGETTYYVRVKAHCGDEDESDYSNVVNFTTLVACQAPTVLTVTEGSVTTNQVELSWTENGTATAWQICLNGDETNLIAANSNPFTLESLTAATTYTVKVRANCGGIDGESAWSNEVSFATDCDAITITEDNTYRQGFEGYQGTTYSSGDVLPVCWNSYSEGSTLPHITSSGSYHYVHEGTNTLYFYGAAQTNSYVALPEFTNGLNTLQINFWMQTESATGYGELSLGYITAEDNNFNTYQVIETYENHINSMVEITTQIKNVPATATRLAFRWAHPSTSWHGCCIDDVEVSLLHFTKTIEAVGEENWEDGKGGYYLIASPVAENIMPSEDNGFIVGDYDLYYFSQTGDSEGNEWINFNDETLGGFDIVNGKGYLYASKEGTTLTFTGTANTNGTVGLDTYVSGAYWNGWNLIGNPLAETAYIDRPFYTMNSTGVLEEQLEETAIEAMEGVFVIAGETETSITFSTEAPAKSGSLALNLTQGRAFVDRAIVRFDEGRELPKFQLNENNTKVFFKQDNKDYAVVKAEGMGEMPVSFKAEKNGSFTMNVTSDEVSFSYLHLIDNMTGADVDLLANPTYSFNASTTDYESRFRLVFATGSSVADDTFGFINGAGNLSIFGIEGEATLQVMDVNGRVLSTETFSGSIEKHLNVAAGIYMLRLINGDNVKVQKVVVK